MPRWFRACFLAALLTLVGATSSADEVADFADQVDQLVQQLGADTEADRQAAHRQLLDLAGPTSTAGERMLAALPEPVDQMPAAVRTALASLRKQIAEELARLTVTESRVTLDVVAEPLEDVLTQIEQQTGNKLKDLREQFGQQAPDRPITIEIDDAPFWEAVDQVLDEAGLGVYAYAGEPAVAVVNREPGATPRWATAAYAGPLRIEPTRVTASRNLRQVSGESLNLQLEVAWEPRLTPIAFSLPLSGVQAKNEDGAMLSLARPERSIDIEVSPDGLATEMTLPMLLPTRNTKLISSLQGTLQASVPGRRAEFRFEKLTETNQAQTQQHGGAKVTLDRMRKSGEIWELHMRLQLESASGADPKVEDPETQNAFASHRGWVFNNLTYLEDAAGNRIEHAGFETTMQRGNTIGIAYLFDLAMNDSFSDPAPATDDEANPADGNPLANYTWVYRTATTIVRFPVAFELNRIPLP